MPVQNKVSITIPYPELRTCFRYKSEHRTRHIFFFSCTHLYFPASGQAVVTGVVPSSPRFLPSIFIAHKSSAILLLVDFSLSVLLTHALALSASQLVRKKESPRTYRTSMHSGGLELATLTYIYQARGSSDTSYHTLITR